MMWRLSPIGYVPGINGHSSILTWFDCIFDRWKGSDVWDQMESLVTQILGRIWKCHYGMVFNGVSTDPQRAVYHVVTDAMEFDEDISKRELDGALMAGQGG